jgi:hypothetical protein
VVEAHYGAVKMQWIITLHHEATEAQSGALMTHTGAMEAIS